MKKITLFCSSLLLCFGLIGTPPADANKLIKWEFKLKPLPYDYDTLEPYIDKETMIIHHNKHEQSYINNLNKLIQNSPELQNKSLEWLLTNECSLPEDIKTGILNNAGGVYNHNFFWSILSSNKDGKPIGTLKKAIDRDFGSFIEFKELFKDASLNRFGSGWVWLVEDSYGKLSILSTPNQETPITNKLNPVLTLDLWEHAYYLKYRNIKEDYIDNFFHIINWNQAETNYNK